MSGRKPFDPKRSRLRLRIGSKDPQRVRMECLSKAPSVALDHAEPRMNPWIAGGSPENLLTPTRPASAQVLIGLNREAKTTRNRLTRQHQGVDSKRESISTEGENVSQITRWCGRNSVLLGIDHQQIDRQTVPKGLRPRPEHAHANAHSRLKAAWLLGFHLISDLLATKWRRTHAHDAPAPAPHAWPRARARAS